VLFTNPQRRAHDDASLHVRRNAHAPAPIKRGQIIERFSHFHRRDPLAGLNDTTNSSREDEICQKQARISVISMTAKFIEVS
jgi:hypothetical protein